MVRRLIGLACAIGMLVGALLADNDYESCFRKLVNFERAKEGVPALEQDGRLDLLASNQSKAMKAKGMIFHNPNLAAQVPAFAAVGENVGMGPSCSGIHAAFMASPGHKANILDRDYTHLGVGVDWKQDPDSPTGVELFVAEVFFRPRSIPAPAPPPKKSSLPKPQCTCPR